MNSNVFCSSQFGDEQKTLEFKEHLEKQKIHGCQYTLFNFTAREAIFNLGCNFFYLVVLLEVFEEEYKPHSLSILANA